MRPSVRTSGESFLAGIIGEAAAAVAAAGAARAARRWRQVRATALETLSVERHALLAGLFRRAGQEEKAAAGASGGVVGRLGVVGLAALLRSPTLDLGLDAGLDAAETDGGGAWRLALELVGSDHGTLDFSQLVRAVAAHAKETVARGEAGNGGGSGGSGGSGSVGGSGHRLPSYAGGGGERDVPVPPEAPPPLDGSEAAALAAHLRGTALEPREGLDIRSLGVHVRRAFNRRSLGPNDSATDGHYGGEIAAEALDTLRRAFATLPCWPCVH
jgi:hypothetical protein